MSETHVHGIDEANMERRTFLKGSMTAAALLGAAGMFGCAPNAAKQEGMKQEEAETADMPDTGAWIRRPSTSAGCHPKVRWRSSPSP